MFSYVTYVHICKEGERERKIKQTKKRGEEIIIINNNNNKTHTCTHTKRK